MENWRTSFMPPFFNNPEEEHWFGHIPNCTSHHWLDYVPLRHSCKITEVSY